MNKEADHAPPPGRAALVKYDGGSHMEDENFTADELEFFIRMCEAAKLNGLNWPLAVANFPAETDEEKRWKERNLKGIPHCKAKGR
jgi:hypothetical protein